MDLYIAVIIREHSYSKMTGETSWESLRNAGDWSSYVDTDKSKAVTKALTLRDKINSPQSGYRVFVGTLTEEANPLHKFELVPIE